MKTIVKKADRFISPILACNVFHEQPWFAVLDSSLKGENGRYTIIGLHPYLILKEEHGVAYGNGKPLPRPFEDKLADILAALRETNDTDLPLISGGIGYFSYDYGCKFEKIPISHPSSTKLPEAMFVFYDNFIIFDLLTEETYITAKGILEPEEHSIAKIEQLLVQAEPKQKETADYQGTMTFDFTKEEYTNAVNAVIDHIREGDVYIANLTQQMTIETELPPYALFQKMRKTNPSPFGGYFNGEKFQIVSASPERFLKINGSAIETKPIKGTRKRGQNKTEDAALRAELERSEKDRSELLMIVDLERNDLNRICVPGSVEVTKHFDIETYATVFHLVSTVRGQLRPEIRYDDILKAVFPGGSITGAPKIEAMKIIDTLEHSARGLYTGSMGYISFDGNCDWNIVIRTAVYQDGTYHIGIGGGITCESDPEAEYEETLQKAKAFCDIFQKERRK
ncbi:MAG: aminodeoxychorismate synthase component I [Firmicutes bacterium]|nr:aminodeoxychorismate synthase component I [Bacillota bacterium]